MSDLRRAPALLSLALSACFNPSGTGTGDEPASTGTATARTLPSRSHSPPHSITATSIGNSVSSTATPTRSGFIIAARCAG